MSDKRGWNRAGACESCARIGRRDLERGFCTFASRKISKGMSCRHFVEDDEGYDGKRRRNHVR